MVNLRAAQWIVDRPAIKTSEIIKISSFFDICNYRRQLKLQIEL